MCLVTMDFLLKPARAQRRAIGAFTVWGLASMQAVINAAEELNQPVILQTGPMEINHIGLRPLARLMIDMAQQAKVPVAVHLDHGNSFEMAMQCINQGFTSVMLDASHLPFNENVRAMKDVVRAAHACGITAEGELGRIGGEEAGINVNDTDAHLTDPDEAIEYVKQTGIDALAVAIGTAHGFYKSQPNIRLERLKQIAEKISIPLVLHGGTGIPADTIKKSIALGISKINICTEFVAAFANTFVSQQKDTGFKYNVPGVFTKPRATAVEVIKQKIKLYT